MLQFILSRLEVGFSSFLFATFLFMSAGEFRGFEKKRGKVMNPNVSHYVAFTFVNKKSTLISPQNQMSKIII